MRVPFLARLVTFTAAVLIAAPPAHSSLVGYWKFDEVSGTVANDSSANGNNGTLAAIPGGAVPTWVAGHSGNALNFAQGVVTVPDTVSLHIASTFTVAAWIYDTGSNYGHLFNSGDGTAGIRNWFLQTSNSGTDSAYFWSTSNASFRRKLNLVPPLNAWNHVAVTYDGTTMRSYLNGTIQATTYTFTSALSTWGPTLYLGGVGGVNGSGVNGKLDDMVIFNTAESAANVTLIMNGTHPAMLSSPLWSGGGTLNGSGQLVWTSAANWGGTAMTSGQTLTFATAAAPGATTNYNDFANNTQFSGITFNSGTAAFTVNGNAINLTGNVTNNSANSQTIGNSLTLDGGARTFNAATGDVVLSAGLAQAAAQTNGVVKTGAFKLKLNGTSTYTGTTSVNAGELLLNGATLGNTATTVSGSTAKLSGNGAVGGALTAQTSGHLAPGINATTTGTLTCTSGLTLNAASLDIKAGALGASDLVSVTGDLTLTGNTQVNLTSQLAGFGLGDYVILTYTGTLTGSVSQLLPPPPDVNYSYSIQATGNQIKLHVVASSARTFYVSQSAGSDLNTGLSSASPWKTLAKASTPSLVAGDQILLKAGDTWNEELQPKGNGTATNPIYIGSYGTGNKPIIDRGDVAQQNGIHLIDQEGYKIVGLEFSHCETGVWAEYHTGQPVRDYLWIEDCYFHDSLRYGNYASYYTTKNISVGISIWTFLSYSSNVSLQNITVKNCTFRRMASGFWTNSPDNFDYNADNFYNFANVNILGCLFEEGYQWQLGFRGILGGQVANCVTHDIGRNNNAFNGVAGGLFYRTKNYSVTDSEWGFVSRNGGGSGDGEAFDLEGNNDNVTFTRCLFHDADGPCFMLYQGAAHGNFGIVLNDCVWNGKAPLSNLGREEIFNATAGSATATFLNSRFYLAPGVIRCNNNTGMTFDPTCLSRNLSAAGTGTNLTLSATTVAASSQQVGFEATKGGDANTATIWRPTAWVGNTGSDYLELNFASPVTVNEFRLRQDPASSITRYAIQYWDATASAWVGCFNGRTMVTDPGGAGFIAPIVGRTTTKLRLLVTATTSGTPGIAEFEAYYVALPPPPNSVSWRVGSAVWDINTTNNWKTTGGAPSNYLDGDIVALDDTASGAGPITLTLNSTVAPLSVTVNATKDYLLTGSGGIGGAATLTKNSSGILTLSSTNTYTGTTTVNAGTLRFGSAANLPSTGGITLGGGTLEFTGSGSAGTYNLTAASSSSYLVNVSNATGILTVTRASGNYNGMIKTGAGTVILANNNQDAGGLRVDAGTIVLSGTSGNPVNYSNTNTISDVLAGAVLKLGNTQVGNIFYDGGTFHMSGGTFDVNGQNPTADQNHSAPVIDGSGTITNTAAGTTGTALFKVGTNRTFSGNIMDGAGAAKVAITLTSGGSTWTLSGSNTYSGATAVSSGILQAGAMTALSPNSAYTVASGKTLAVNGYNNTIGSLAGAGSVTLGTATLTMGSDNTSPAAFTGVISSVTGGAIIKTGAGTLTLNSSQTYNGTTTVNAGTLAEGSSGFIADTSDLTVNGATAIFALGANHSDTVGTVTVQGGGSITGSGSSALAASAGRTFEMQSGTVGAILAGSGIALNKTTSGSVTLSGVNTYTGPTSVTGGTLNITGSIASSTVTVSGATSLLGGSGGTPGAVTIQSGGTLSPGLNSAGTLSVGNVTLNATANYRADILGVGSYDILNVIGTVNLGTATASLVVPDSAPSVSLGNLFFILKNDGTDAVTGTFAGLGEKATLTVGANNYQITYLADSTANAGAGNFTGGNDVALKAIYAYGNFAAAYGLGAGSENLDLDNDGYSNVTEYLLGTDPALNSSRPVLTHTRNANGENQLAFTRPGSTHPNFPSEGSVLYKGQVSSDLVTWADIAIPAPTAVNTESVTVTDAGFPIGPLNPTRFIRLWLAK